MKVLPSGARKYLVKYRVHGGGRAAAQRWIALGAHGSITCDQARSMAQQILASVARGEDPQADKFTRRNAPTLHSAWDRFETDLLSRRKAPTQREYSSQWLNIIRPYLGGSLIDDISRADVDRLHKSLAKTPYRANRVLALLSKLLNLAEGWDWRPQGTNPCRFVERYPEKARERYLGADELNALGRVLREMVSERQIEASAANAIKLLLMTGARLNELLTAKWAWLKLDLKLLSLPDSKTGAKPIYLSDAALIILTEQREIATRKSSDFIFPGRSPGKHMINLRKPWDRVCLAAGISNVRLHDLRHTAASIAVGQGASLPIIGRLLGHSQAQTTLRYAHVDTDPALSVANQIGSILEARFNK